MDATALAGRQSLTQALYCPRDLRSLIVDVPPGGGSVQGPTLSQGIRLTQVRRIVCVCMFLCISMYVCM